MMSIKRNLTAGLLAAIPLWVTWLVIAFVLGLAIDMVGPFIEWMVALVQPESPRLVEVLSSFTFQNLVSVLVALVILYWLGWLTNNFLGRRLMIVFDTVLEKMPFVGKVYGGTKRVIEAFQSKPEKAQQVVLIEYPHPGMKTVGLVTRTLTDTTSGQLLLAVYVPTTPNPTSGFLEIVPAESATPTDWSVNDALTFVVSGGSVGPETVVYKVPEQPKPGT
jgi:uncharacterized membrane protein